MPPGKRKGPSSSSSKRGRSELDKLAAASDSDNEDGLLQLHDGTAAADSDELGGFDEEAVYGLDDDDSDEDKDEGESEDDEEDDEDVLEEALLRGGKQAQLAKQAQYLQQKLKLQQREDESDEDEEGGDDDEQQQQRGEQTLGDKLWGANKRAYYQTEDAEVDSDDALAQEEQEARQLQAAQAAALDDDDYALPGLDAAAAAAAAGGDGDGAGSGPVSLAAAAAGGAGGVEVETVARDVEGLTAEQQAAVVMSDAPELLSLLAELRDSLAEVRGRIGPLLREVSTGGLATSAGLSYLEAKHLLLLQYCMCIVAYLLIKAEGRSVVGHPVLHRLAQLRVYIEKIRPIDKQLSYQVDKLLRATAKVQASADSDAAAAAAAGEQQQQDGAAAAAVGGGHALQYRPNPQALISKVPLVGDTAGLSSEAAATGGGVYRPPKLNPVAMPEDRAVSNKEMRQIREAQRRAQRSAVMRELAQELAGAPEEVGAELPGMDTAAAVAARQRLEARAAAEEELMLRVPLSKAEAKKLKAQRRAGLSGAVGLTDFADDVADLVATSTAAEGGGGGGAGGSGLSELFGKHKLSQRYGADLSAQQQAQIRSGDADVELRKPLHERRAAFDAVAARRAAAAADADMDGGGGGGYGDDEYDYEAFAGRGGKGMGSSGKKRQRGDGFGGGEEDEFYTAAKAGRASSKAAKAAAHAVPAHLEPPLPEPEAVGQRKISYEIEKNRGLTPHRRKDLKNPRKKHRVKFAQAVVRRKGQVQGMQQAPSSARGYGGEATGIKSRVSKSTRLG